MVVYIETVLLTNFAINALVIYLTLITVRQRLYFMRIFLASLLGALLALTIPFLNGNLIIYRIASIFLLVSVIANYSELKHYFLCFLVFMVYTFLLAGITEGLINLFSPTVFAKDTEWLPFWISLSALLMLVGIRMSLKFILKARSISKNSFRVEVSISKRIYRVNAYYDTGNRLYEPKTMTPIVMLSPKYFNNVKTTQQIKVSTVSGFETLKAMPLDYIKIYNDGRINKIENIVGALSKTEFNGYQMLLHSDMV